MGLLAPSLPGLESRVWLRGEFQRGMKGSGLEGTGRDSEKDALEFDCLAWVTSSIIVNLLLNALEPQFPICKMGIMLVFTP